MKRHLVLCILCTVLSIPAAGLSSPPKGPRIQLDGRLNTPCISERGATAFLHLSLLGRDDHPIRRKPMNISVVLDRSGSMADAGKIEYAKQALHRLVDQLSRGDILSIVIYDDEIDVLLSGGHVGSKPEIHRLIDQVYPRNATNLGGGMMEGFRQAERYASREYVNRVILLSDGLANRGIVDEHDLCEYARRYRRESISLTTMGVGLEYNENLMVGLAESGGGNYYFIESPRSLASILHQELNSATNVLAQNVTIEIIVGKGVEVKSVIGGEYTRDGNRYVIAVGDLCTDQLRDFTVELYVPPGEGSQLVARGTVHCDDAGDRIARLDGFSASVSYARDVAVVEKKRDLKVQARVDMAVSTRKVEEALKKMDDGDMEGARQDLAAARETVVNSRAAAAGAAPAELNEQASRLEGYEQMLGASKDSRDSTARAKKAIQYENYRTQKKK